MTKYRNVNSRLATNKALINDLCQFKGYGSRRLLTKFQEINWNKKGLQFTEKDSGTRSTNKARERRPNHARTEENAIALTTVDELVLSKETSHKQ